ncbi:MAG: hypothetical protein AMXMBFR82_00980 [Candidatus Hydrogenedentota bacterium]
MARRNFQFEKRQKEIAKQKTREEKLRRKREKPDSAPEDEVERPNDDETPQ